MVGNHLVPSSGLSLRFPVAGYMQAIILKCYMKAFLNSKRLLNHREGLLKNKYV